MTVKKLCPICGRMAMQSAGNPATAGVCDACGANLGGVNVELIRAARRRAMETIRVLEMEREPSTMKGQNMIRMSLDTMKEAIQQYLDRMFVKKAPLVTMVSEDPNEALSFTVEVDADADREGPADG